MRTFVSGGKTVTVFPAGVPDAEAVTGISFVCRMDMDTLDVLTLLVILLLVISLPSASYSRIGSLILMLSVRPSTFASTTALSTPDTRDSGPEIRSAFPSVVSTPLTI